MDWDNLKRKVELQLKNAGMHIPNLDKSNIETRRLEMEARENDTQAQVVVAIYFSKAPQSDLYAFHVETKLARRVILPHHEEMNFMLSLGQCDETIKFANEQELASKIEATIDDHIAYFIRSFEQGREDEQKYKDSDDRAKKQKLSQTSAITPPSNATQQKTQPQPQQISSYPFVSSQKQRDFSQIDLRICKAYCCWEYRWLQNQGRSHRGG